MGHGVRALARRLGITIVAGAFTPGSGGRVRNTLIVAGPTADTDDSYDKMHLFDAFGYAESDSVEGGERAVTVTVGETPVGLATCYDIRFSSLFVANAAAGARLSVVCASWGAGPGKVEQWSCSRAPGRSTRRRWWSPWGRATRRRRASRRRGCPDRRGAQHGGVAVRGGAARAGAAPELLVVDVDLATVSAARESLPVLANQRFAVGALRD